MTSLKRPEIRTGNLFFFHEGTTNSAPCPSCLLEGTTELVLQPIMLLENFLGDAGLSSSIQQALDTRRHLPNHLCLP